MQSCKLCISAKEFFKKLLFTLAMQFHIKIKSINTRLRSHNEYFTLREVYFLSDCLHAII